MARKTFYQVLFELTDVQRVQLLKEYERFVADGQIGDCLLRQTARKVIAETDVKNDIVWWMREIAMECYREFAWRYISHIGLIPL